MILDSCILIDISRERQPALEYVTALAEIPSVSVLTVTEVMRGVRRDKEARILGDIFAKWSVLPVTFEIASLAAEYLRIHAPSHGVDIVDAVIAATAQAHELELITLNLKHFPMFPGLVRPY